MDDDDWIYEDVMGNAAEEEAAGPDATAREFIRRLDAIKPRTGAMREIEDELDEFLRIIGHQGLADAYRRARGRVY